MTPRSWFLAPRAPNFDCSPTGYLALGSLVEDPYTPDCPIASGLPPPLPEYIHVERSTKKNWESVDERRRNGKIGLWVHFVDLIQGDVSTNWERAEATVYQCETLETNWFRPSPQLIRDRLSNEEVAEFTKQAGSFQRKMFMITAVQIARKPAVKKTKDGAWGVGLNVGADLAPVGAAGLSVGAENAISHSRHSETSASESSDFVYAYRLDQIMYKRTQLPLSKPHTKGATFSDDARTREDEILLELDIENAKLVEVVASEHGYDTILAHDDIAEQECECVIT
jgi:hypothetical protein